MLAFMGLGPSEVLMVFVVVLLFFGGRKIPELARALGKGMREFKKARDGIDDAVDDALQKDAKPTAKSDQEPQGGK